MFIVGQMALGVSTTGVPFPLWRECLRSLRDLSDALYLRFDILTGDPTMYQELLTVCGPKLRAVCISWAPWDRWSWREEMLRMLDGVRPDIVLSPDQDEQFSEGIEEDVRSLWEGPNNALWFSCSMPTVEGSEYPFRYPGRPHMKAYKWRPCLTYQPYRGGAVVSNYFLPADEQPIAMSTLQHFCCYTPELRAQRKAQGAVDDPRWRIGGT